MWKSNLNTGGETPAYPPRPSEKTRFSDGLFIHQLQRRATMLNAHALKPVPVSVIGTYDSLEAASRQVDLFMLKQDPDAGEEEKQGSKLNN